MEIPFDTRTLYVGGIVLVIFLLLFCVCAWLLCAGALACFCCYKEKLSFFQTSSNNGKHGSRCDQNDYGDSYRAFGGSPHCFIPSYFAGLTDDEHNQGNGSSGGGAYGCVSAPQPTGSASSSGGSGKGSGLGKGRVKL